MMNTLRILSKLKFAPNLGQVNVTLHSNSLSKSLKLTKVACFPEFFHHQNGASISAIGLYETRRHYNKRKTIKKPPTKPLNFGFAGEIGTSLEILNLSEPRPGYEDLDELQSADDVVRKIFSLEMADGQVMKAKRMENILSQVREHPTDLQSLEVRIAEYTVHIRHQMKHMLEFRKDKKTKIILFHRIQKRRSLIEQLRRSDFEKFEWLLKELKIKYTPISENNQKIGRKELRRIAAQEKFSSVKRSKLEEFRKKLAEERILFEEIKKNELNDIEKQLKDFNIAGEVSSLQQTLDALDLGEPYVMKPQRKMKRRLEVLAKKFEMYKHRREDSLK